MKILLALVFLVLLGLSNTLCFGQQATVVEKRLTDLLKETHGTRDMQVKLESGPAHLKQGTKVKSVNIQKMPEIEGKGLAVVEFEGEDGRPRVSYVPFRVYEKKTLFYMKRALSKGSPISADDLGSRETYVSENELIYPKEPRDVLGRKSGAYCPEYAGTSTHALGHRGIETRRRHRLFRRESVQSA